ncbi:MAG: peptidoglycan bridge formation glycyltransferase FemA/FemB family protein [Candidatus Magasanikbacteria bacterium]
MYDIKEITNKQEWEEFLSQEEYVLMKQSYKNGEFHKSMGENYWLIGIYENNILIGGSMIISVHARRGNFLLAPYGPIIRKDYQNVLTELMKFLKAKAEKEKYNFIKFSPFIDESEENKRIYQQVGFRKAPIHILAETSWLLDLSLSEEKLLFNMNKNHRNLINRCLREKVKITFSKEIQDLKEFNTLLDHTAKKHHFVRFSNNYLEKEFIAFEKDNEVSVIKAYLPEDQKIDAGAVVYFYGNSAAYRHGASLVKNKKLPTSYLVQWEAIKEAKRRGMKYYNFWGIAPDNASDKHPFKGITHFKKGFGGFQKNLLPAHDYIVSKKYWFNWIIETIRSKKRGF